MNKGHKVEPNIYRQPSGQFVVVANIPYLDVHGRKRYRRPHKTFQSLSEARAWLHLEKSTTLPQKPEPTIWRGGCTLGQLSEQMLVEKEQDGQSSLIDTRRQHRRLLDFFGPETRIDLITREWVRAYRDYLQSCEKMARGEGRISNATVNRYLAALRHMLRYAVEEDLIERAPAVRLLRQQSKPKELEIDLADYLRMVDFLPGPPHHQRALALLALNTATRWGDASRFTYGQILLKPVKHAGRFQKALHLQYRSSKTRSGYISIPILDITKEALEDVLQHPLVRSEPGFVSLETLVQTRLRPEPDRFLFVNPRTNKPFTSMKRALESAVHRAGIARITFHDIRRLMTTIIIEETGDRDLAQDVGRWSDQAMRKHYTSIGKRPRRAFAKINATIERERGSGLSSKGL